MTSTCETSDSASSDRGRYLGAIEDKINRQFPSLEEAIRQRDLYFRVSLIGSCNLHCRFCHNEGAPLKGVADLAFVRGALVRAYEVGFRRVQFTGGEPLLHPLVADFVASARDIFGDVGITTNGTYLPRNIDSLIRNKITRIHVSLQVEELQHWGNAGAWGEPDWLAGLLSMAREGLFRLRLNFPIPEGEIDQAFGLIASLSTYGCDIKVFALLPSKDGEVDYPLAALAEAVANENSRRRDLSLSGHVLLRAFHSPQGIRCKSCSDFHLCKEQSHSLRLGADRVLRPCLATRLWDSLLQEKNMQRQILEATYLALDY